jgi:hypothetical protein
MSGPKVVRIVTREEILEICHGHLARVDAALAEWTRIGRRNACIGEDEIAAATGRRDALAKLIAADRFMDVQKQAPIEEGFLRDDTQARLAKLAAAQAAARGRVRREVEAATSLLRTLRASGRHIDPDLESGLERGEAAALSRGFQLLSANVPVPGASSELAAGLQEEGSSRTFGAWLASQPAPPADPAMARIEVRLEELALYLDADAILPLRRRLDEAVGAIPARRALLLDGLEVETGRALTEARRRGALISDLSILLAELKAGGLQTHAYEGDLEKLDSASLELRIAQARETLTAHRAVLAAAARRAAVLEGLAGLGYEVNVGMTTMFAQNGRLVLRSAARPDYGVEVSAVGGAERMQMRAVAFEAGGRGPDPARDRDAETIWCGDVSTLQGKLAEVGGGLRIERASPVGATPLKRIAVDGNVSPAGAEAPAMRERTLR